MTVIALRKRRQGKDDEICQGIIFTCRRVITDVLLVFCGRTTSSCARTPLPHSHLRQAPAPSHVHLETKRKLLEGRLIIRGGWNIWCGTELGLLYSIRYSAGIRRLVLYVVPKFVGGVYLGRQVPWLRAPLVLLTQVAYFHRYPSTEHTI